MNNEKIEKKLVSLILESSKHSLKLTKKYLPQTKKLFESVFFEEKIESPVDYNECRQNKLFYFQQVKNELLSLQKSIDSESLKIINESIATNNFQNSVNSFLTDISLEINNLQFQNDLDKIDILDSTVKKTLFFSGRPLNVVGFNIQQVLDSNNIISKEIFEKFGANSQDLKLMLFNKSDKELYFIYERKNTNEKTIIFYNILTNVLDYLSKKDFHLEFGTNKENFYKIIWKDESKYLKVIGSYINNNLIELYRNNNLYTLKFEDNLYGDFAYQKRNEKIAQQKLFK